MIPLVINSLAAEVTPGAHPHKDKTDIISETFFVNREIAHHMDDRRVS